MTGTDQPRTWDLPPESGAEVTREATCAIEVNEGIVEATRRGCDWWHLHRQRLVSSGKLRETTPACVVGGVVDLGPYAEDDAQFIAGHMVTSGGMPQSAIKVKRWRPLTDATPAHTEGDDHG